MTNIPNALLNDGHVEGTPHRMGPWTGGVRYDIPQELVPVDSLFKMQDMEIGPSGECRKRPGSSTHIATAPSSNTGVGVGKIRFSASTERKFYCMNAIFYEDVNGTWTDRSGGLTISNDPDNFLCWVDAFGTGFFTDGVNAPFKWAAAGGNVTTAGISARFTTARGVSWHDQRVWWWNTNSSEGEIWFSDQDNLEAIGANSFFDVKGPITAVAAVNKTLYVHTYDQVWRIDKTGNTTSPYQLHPSIKFGAGSVRNIGILPGGRQVIGRTEGFYLWDGASAPIKISQQLEGERYWNEIQSEAIEELDIMGMLVNPIKGHVWCFLTHFFTSTTINHVMVYDYLRNRWFGPYNIAASSWAFLDGNIYTTGYSDGLVHVWDASINDSGTAIASFMETSAVAPEGEIYQTQWHFARVYYNGQNTAADVTATQSGPGIGTLSSTNSISSGYQGIGSIQIGVSAIAGPGVLNPRDIDLQGFGVNSKIKLENEEINETFNVRFIDQVYTSHGIVRRDDG